MTTLSSLTGPLIASESRINNRGIDFVKDRFRKYGVSKYAVYVDHTTLPKDIPDLPDLVGYYSFDIKLAGSKLLKTEVKLISLEGPIPDCDGWLVASTSRASSFSLSKALLNSQKEHQIITRYYGGQTSEISAYMDIFSGETETIMYVNHYFDRKYRIPFPIDMRFTVCKCDGAILHSGQQIIPPGGIITFDSRNMNLGEFKGYLQVELEVENLQTRVQPFIHFWADYFNDAGMCRNHQSGWAPWPPSTVFNRGYLPLDQDLEAFGSFYNDNEFEVRPQILLHYVQNGEDKTVERHLEPIAAQSMSYQNYSELFHDISLEEGVSAAYILITCHKPLHRPNHYIAIKGTNKVVDTYHQTGGKACFWAKPADSLPAQDIELFRKFNMDPWDIRLPVLHERFGIDTYLGLLSLTIVDISEVIFKLFDHVGNEQLSVQENIDGSKPIFLNINEYALKHGVDLPNGGVFSISPLESNKKICMGTAVFFGLKHKDFSYISTSFRGSPTEVNLPYYVNKRFPHSREYEYSPLQISDHFCPGVYSDEFDTLFIVEHSSLHKDYSTSVEYRLELIDSEGNLCACNRTISPQSHDVFWLSEIINKNKYSSDKPYCTLWFKSYDRKIKPFHALYRKEDHAMSFDDGSEGTLQKEPQIAGIDPMKRYKDFYSFMKKQGLAKHFPSSFKQQVYEFLRKI